MTVTHIVHFRYHMFATNRDRKALVSRFRALRKESTGPDGRPLILEFDGGANNSPEGRDYGLDVSSSFFVDTGLY